MYIGSQQFDRHVHIYTLNNRRGGSCCGLRHRFVSGQHVSIATSTATPLTRIPNTIPTNTTTMLAPNSYTLHLPFQSFYPSLARAGFQTIKDIFHKPLPASRTVAATLYGNLKSCILEWWGNLPMAEYTSSFVWKEQLYLFASSNQPVHLRNLTIGQIYYRLRDEVMSEVPTCRDKLPSSLGRPINTTMWEHLWLVPHGFQLITPYFRDILWKFLHRVLPTKAQLVKCRLVDNSVCLACQSFEESIDHMYGHCIN